jgi:hypothetical protein
MDNPETHEILSRRHRKKTSKTETNTTPKTKKKINNTDTTKSARENKQFLFLTRKTNNKTLVYINFIFS